MSDERDFTPDLEPEEGQDYIEPSDGPKGAGDQNVAEGEEFVSEYEPLPDEAVEV